jgi:hypothetical protein
MRKIELALILFQLIAGCSHQPAVTPRPEKKQEGVTPQDDTPQAPKTNYLKRGAYIVGVILTILASIGLIAYCCTRTGKEEGKKEEEEGKKEEGKKEE